MRLNTGPVVALFSLIHGLAANPTGALDHVYDFHVGHLELDGITRTVVNGQSRSSIPRLSSRLTCMRVAYQVNTQVS